MYSYDVKSDSVWYIVTNVTGQAMAGIVTKRMRWSMLAPSTRAAITTWDGMALIADVKTTIAIDAPTKPFRSTTTSHGLSVHASQGPRPKTPSSALTSP